MLKSQLNVVVPVSVQKGSALLARGEHGMVADREGNLTLNATVRPTTAVSAQGHLGHHDRQTPLGDWTAQRQKGIAGEAGVLAGPELGNQRRRRPKGVFALLKKPGVRVTTTRATQPAVSRDSASDRCFST